MMKVLMRIEAPHYVAGIVFENGKATKECAPIIKWMNGKEWNWVVAYLNSKKFSYMWIEV